MRRVGKQKKNKTQKPKSILNVRDSMSCVAFVALTMIVCERRKKNGELDKKNNQKLKKNLLHVPMYTRKQNKKQAQNKKKLC